MKPISINMQSRRGSAQNVHYNICTHVQLILLFDAFTYYVISVVHYIYYNS